MSEAIPHFASHKMHSPKLVKALTVTLNRNTTTSCYVSTLLNPQKYFANYMVRPSFVASYESGKGKAIPLQSLTGPEGSSRLRLPDFKTIGT
jgi:hypothetical protein